MNPIQTVSQHLERLLRVTLALLMTAMVLDVTWQVLTRFILPQPSSFTEELARFLLMWIGLVGAAYAYRRHAHLSLDLLRQHTSAQHQLWLNRAIQVICMLFALSVMVFGGIKLMALTLSLGQTSPALGVPVGYVYLCIPLSGALIAWFALENLLYPDSPDTELSS